MATGAGGRLEEEEPEPPTLPTLCDECRDEDCMDRVDGGTACSIFHGNSVSGLSTQFLSWIEKDDRKERV
jgi:hypothetical protein